MATSTITQNQLSQTTSKNIWVTRIGRNWLLIFSIIYGLYVGLPFLAPVLMHLGWEMGGRAIYLIYTFLCHQLPERSLFFFGTKTMYPLSDIQAAWQETINPFILRQFIGNPQMGWKMAWSDRMVAMYTSILIFAWIWYPLRRKIKRLPLWAIVIFLIPMGIDGFSHLISDFAGIGQGFRDTNTWLAGLTHYSLPPTFYIGDALGSFNSWMRWISGIIFGLGVVLLGFPILDETFSNMAHSPTNGTNTSNMD